MNNSDVDDLNKKLADRYGTNLVGEPHFRIVWSEDITEVRIGNFSDYYRHIFVRTVREARRCRKYNYIRFRWILEMWHPSPSMFKIPELPVPDCYEPIFVFESSKGEALPPIWPACELVCHTILNPVMDQAQMKDYIDAMDGQVEEKDRKHFEDMFDMTWMSSLLHTKEAVGFTKEIITDGTDTKLLHGSEHSTDISES